MKGIMPIVATRITTLTVCAVWSPPPAAPPCSAPVCTTSSVAAALTTGSAQYGSAAVRSVNHQRPPVVISVSLPSPRPLSAKKKVMKSGICTKGAMKPLSGWQSWSRKSCCTRCDEAAMSCMSLVDFAALMSSMHSFTSGLMLARRMPLRWPLIVIGSSARRMPTVATAIVAHHGRPE
jgi:hypothetical protein